MIDAIIYKNKSLNSLISKNVIPAQEDITKFIDYIVFAVHNHKCNIDILDELYDLFRKWKTLVNIYYCGSYDKSLDKASNFYCELTKYDFNEVNKFIVKHSNETINFKKFDTLTRIVNPYYDLPISKISKIDKEFFSKYSTLSILNNAVSEFKKCNIEKSIFLNIEALSGLKQFEKLDDLNLYFCSWALHNLGNIEFIKSNFKQASYFFHDSLKIKEQIEVIPQIHIYSTRLKFLTSRMREKKAFDYIDELKSFYFEVECNKKTSEENPAWHQNILIDSSYNLARSYFYNNNFDSAERFLSICIKKGKENNDKIGLLKGYILKIFMSESPRKIINNINSVIGSLSPKNKKSPHLGLLLSEDSISEWELLNNQSSNLLISTFEKNGIYRKKLPLTKYCESIKKRNQTGLNRDINQLLQK